MKYWSLFAILPFLLTTATPLSLYSYTFDNQLHNSAFYPLGLVNTGNTLMVNLTTKGTTLDFSTTAPSLTDQAQNSPGAPSFEDGCLPGQNYCTRAFDVKITGNYTYGLFAPDHPWQSF